MCDGGDSVLDLQRNAGFVSNEAVQSLPCLSHPYDQLVKFYAKTSLGQQINVSLIDLEVSSHKAWHTCVNYGQVVEMSTMQQTMICGGQRRNKYLMVSNSNKVEIRLNNHQKHSFLLQFEGNVYMNTSFAFFTQNASVCHLSFLHDRSNTNFP